MDPRSLLIIFVSFLQYHRSLTRAVCLQGMLPDGDNGLSGVLWREIGIGRDKGADHDGRFPAIRTTGVSEAPSTGLIVSGLMG